MVEKTFSDAVLAGLNTDDVNTLVDEVIDDSGVNDEDAQAEEADDDASNETDQGSSEEGERDDGAGGEVSGAGEPLPATGEKDQGAGDAGDDMAGWSERTRKRFADLTAQNRQQMAEIQQHQQIRQMLNESIGDPNDFVVMLDYAKAVKTGDYTKALAMLDQARAGLVIRSGIDKPLPDPLSDFPDLLAKVNDYSLDRAAAIEIARARKQQEQQRYMEDNVRREQSAQMHYQQEVQTASAQITALEQQWAVSDPDYKQKMQVITGRVNQIAQQYHPNQWAGVVQMLYENTIVSVPRKVVKTPQPLRAGAGASGAVKVKPKTMEDAILAAIT